MEYKYELTFTACFLRRLKKLTQKNPGLKSTIKQTLELFKEDPFYKGLKTHKATNRFGQLIYSSSVNRDLRIVWKFNNGQRQILNILNIGGHSGTHKVYK